MPISVLDKDGTPQTILTADDLAAILGAVTASPVANTVQDRLKAIATALATNHTDEAALHTDIATTLAGLIGTGNTSLGQLVAALGSTALDYGPGTGGTRTQRVAFDTAQFGTPGPQIATQSTSVTPDTTGTAFWPVMEKPTAAQNGKTPSRVNAAATTNATNLKTSPGQVYDIDLFNAAAYTVFLKFYNKASAPVVGTDPVVWTVPIPPGMGYARSFPTGKSFATGIAYAITKLQADADTTAVAAGDVTGSIGWI